MPTVFVKPGVHPDYGTALRVRKVVNGRRVGEFIADSGEEVELDSETRRAIRDGDLVVTSATESKAAARAPKHTPTASE